MNGTFFREQAQMLKKAGFTVGIIALTSQQPWKAAEPLNFTIEEGIGVVRGSVRNIPSEKLPGEFSVIALQAKKAFQLYEAHCGRPAIAHAHSVYPGIYLAAAASRRWCIPYCLTEHRPSSIKRAHNSPRTREIMRLVRAAQGRATVSPLFAKKLESYYSTSPWTVITLPVPNDAQSVPIPSYVSGSDFIFSHVSHLGDNKRPKLTIRAFARLRNTIPHTRLVVIGGGVSGEIARLKAYCTDLGVADAVDFLGSRPRNEIFNLLSHTHAFVLASAVESAGAVFAEAQMVGLPCIGTRTWGGQYMIGPSEGVTVSIDDESELAQAMQFVACDALYGNPRIFEPERIRKRARERFSETTFATSSGKFYRDSLDCFRRHMS
ncbi:MAG: glycosyltransferase [Actinomyces sp.]|nr:glycosyltransferase [Actinomyces sp.]